MTRSVLNLTVHGIGEPLRELDPGEDATWVSVEQFEQVLDEIKDRPEVRLTFDDGNDSDLRIGLPALLERGLRAEFFVLAGRLGEPARLDADGVRELVRQGMRVGSHGWAHRDWRRLAPGQETEELRLSAEVLGELSGEPVSRVAIPFGSYDRRVLARLRRAGVSLAYTSDGGRARADSWLQPRTSLHRGIGPGWATELLEVSRSARTRTRKLVSRTIKRLR
ncbi:Peptidoglycan/xylan/chitin deacetylase, PgdA/CDA1 family [Nonomuraea maritima]|uniref:Peptidoglycan/xylan/chitin deacetylase, PgdA/CDA1 family n=1 Tax=Nonomuraea maritima TaxID=683260 RepID=A0A1G9MYC8_9ACTN|nr:polysaccharide deacetylase family protein [Nonomuraea maritima]SDL79143.1 Peptidoglycan/xylan/chitin deacetylase, PgdA/CDA1 family [Nonomuraea maritima]